MAYTYADEKARKLRMGEPLNYGKPVAAQSPKPSPAPRGAIPPSYAAAMPAPRPPSGAPASGVSSASKAGYPPPVMVQNSGGIKPPTVTNATKGAIPMAASTTPQTQPTQGGIPQTAPTNYGTDALGKLLYLKDTYNKGVTGGNRGQSTWAAGQSGQYYDQLDPQLAAQVRGMNADQMREFLTARNQPVTQPGPETPTETQSGGAIPNMALTSDQIAQEADYALNKERADLENATNTQSNTTRNNATYAAKLLQDSRVLQDQQMSRTLNPFSGRTTYDKAMVNRGRGIDDTYRAAELENQLNSISQDLYNFDKLAPDKRRELINKATRIEREFGLQEGALTGNYGGDRTLAGQQFDRGVYEDNRNFERGAMESDRDYNFRKTQTEWENMFQKQQFDESKAERLWEQAFQEKSFSQEVKEAAASRGLQWASLSQRDKEFVADSAFREKEFKYRKDQDLLESRNKPPTELSAKTSTDNYNLLLDDIDSGATKEEARTLLTQNSANLTDSDYKKLNDYINDNLY